MFAETSQPVPHISVSELAELVVIAPATANFIGKYTNGIADDALTTYALSHSGQVIIAPAMNPKMWSNPAVQANVTTLKKRGVIFCGPADGRVACGTDGTGRLERVETIVKTIAETIQQ